MSDYDIKAVQLGVRSSNPALPRQWTNMLVSLTANGIQYSPVANPEKVSLLIDLAGIDSIGNYDSGKSEPAFQVKWKGSTTLHKCTDAVTVENWVYKVMAAKMGPSNTSDSTSDSESEEASSSEEEAAKSSPEITTKKLAKSEDKSKKSKSGKDKKAKSKTAEVSSSGKKKSKKEKKAKTGGKENGKESKKSGDSSASASKRSKSESGTDSYVPQFMAHYNGLKQQERQKYFEGLSTQELVKLVSGGLEAEVKESREQILRDWAATKKAKLVELHELEVAELEKKQQRELDDLPKRLKEFSEQSI